MKKIARGKWRGAAEVNYALLTILALAVIIGGIVYVNTYFTKPAPGPVVTGYVDSHGNPVEMPFEFAAVLQKDENGNITAPAGLKIKPVVRNPE